MGSDEVDPCCPPTLLAIAISRRKDGTLRRRDRCFAGRRAHEESAHRLRRARIGLDPRGYLAKVSKRVSKHTPFLLIFLLRCRAARGRCSFAGTGIVAAETGRSPTRRRLTASSGRAWWMVKLCFARRPRSASTTRFFASRPARRGGGARVLIWPVVAPGARPRPAGGRGRSLHGMRRLLACHLPMLSASPAELEFRASSMC